MSKHTIGTVTGSKIRYWYREIECIEICNVV